MRIKCHELQTDVVMTFTPDEIWDLIVICEGSKVLYKQYMREVVKNSLLWKDYKNLLEKAQKIQEKFINVRNLGPIVEIEI